MATTDRGARVANPPWCFAIIVGGVAMSVLFVPFTVAHGPTSYNEERLVAGWSMHGWGLLLGTVPLFFFELPQGVVRPVVAVLTGPQRQLVNAALDQLEGVAGVGAGGPQLVTPRLRAVQLPRPTRLPRGGHPRRRRVAAGRLDGILDDIGGCSHGRPTLPVCAFEAEDQRVDQRHPLLK